jgi:fucose permease
MTDDDEGLDGSTRAALRRFIMVWYFSSGALMVGLVGPLRGSIQFEFGLGKAQFGVLIAVVQFLGSGLVLFAGPRLRKRNTIHLALAGLFLMGAGLTLCFALPNVRGWLLGWAVMSMGASLGSIINNVSMRLWPRDRRKGVIVLHTSNSAGKVFGPLVAALCLSTALLGWRGSFLVAGLFNIALFLVFFLTTRRMAPQFQPLPAAAGSLGFQVFRRSLYWKCILPFGLIAGAEAAFASLMPLYFLQRRGFTASQASLLFSVHLCGILAGRLLAAFYGARLDSNVIIAACVLTGIFIFPALYASSLWVFIPCLLLFGLCFSATWPTYYSQAARFLPHDLDMLAYGAGLSNLTGMSLCVMGSSILANWNFDLGVLSCVVIMAAVFVFYLLSPMSKNPPVETA